MSKSTAAIAGASQGSVHLDAIRGAAALLVFLNHTRALYFSSFVDSQSGPVLLNSTQQVASDGSGHPPLDNGFGEIKLASEAVIIFFVLSGYLVGGSVLRLQRSLRWSWRVYLSKRLTRLYMVLIPALLIGATLDYLGSTIAGPGSVYTAPAGLELVTTVDLSARLRPLILLGNALFLTNIRVDYPGTNVALWSLANEFWYYLAFPMGVLAVISKSPVYKRLLWAAAACAILVFTGRQVASLFPIWIMGALISLLPKTFSMQRARSLSVVFLAGLLLVMAGVRGFHMNALKADYLIALAASLLLYAVVQQVQSAEEGLYKASAGFFSQISYTLYLFHVPLAIFLCGLLNSPWHSWEKTPSRLIAFAGIDILIIAFSYGLWKLFEARTDFVRNVLFG